MDRGYMPDFRVLKAKACLCLSFWKDKGNEKMTIIIIIFYFLLGNSSPL